MAFVGHVFVPPPHVSERARRLNAELQKTIAEFQRREPATSAHDVRHALLLARRGLEAGRPARVAAVAGAAAVASMLGLMFSLRGARGEASEPWAPLAVIAMLAVLAAVALTLHLRRRE